MEMFYGKMETKFKRILLGICLNLDEAEKDLNKNRKLLTGL